MAKPRDDLDIDYVKSILSYDQLSGDFRWLISKGRRVRAGDRAGSVDGGYMTIRVDGRKYRAHRLAWLLVHGEWPVGHIDHANRDPADNRIENLRLATEPQNQANSRARPNKTGFKGVRRNSDGGWTAQLCGKHVGRFRSPEEAHAAYLKAATEKFGEFAVG